VILKKEKEKQLYAFECVETIFFSIERNSEVEFNVDACAGCM
jgi:hypothetical protein